MHFTFRYFVLVFIGLLCFSSSLYAQRPQTGNNPPNTERPKIGVLTGKIIDATNNQPIEFATIMLINRRDSTIFTGGITDKNGMFRIEQIMIGAYRVRIQFVGYKAFKRDTIMFSPKQPDVNLGIIKLQPSHTELETVEITAEKAVFQNTIDRKVFNVEQSLVTAGGSATDVLEQVPSVQVDMDGTISLRGSSNVTILIDGRPSGLMGANRAAILSQIPASSIESIELITNPSSKFDPEGMGGIINIVLKKNKLLGANGMITLSAGTSGRYSGTANMNYRDKKFNLTTSYSFRDNNSFSKRISERQNFIKDTTFSFNQYGNSKNHSVTHTVRGSIDIFLNATNTLGFSGMYNLMDNNSKETLRFENLDENSALRRLYYRNNTNVNQGNSSDISVNYKKKFLKPKQELTTELTRSVFHYEPFSEYVQTEYNLLGNPLNYNDYLENNSSDYTMNVWAFQADYTEPIKENAKFETGIKSTLRNSDNDFRGQYFDTINNTWKDNSLISNHFVFEEQIFAAYANYAFKWNSFGFQTGLRAEQSFRKSELKTNNEKHHDDYFSLFPSVFVTRKLNDKNDEIQISYSRRINRPSPEDMNPFIDYSDPYNLRKGNPYLKPEYIDAAELGIYKSWKATSLTSSVYYRRTNNMVTRIRTIDSTGVSTISMINLNNRDEFGFEFINKYLPFKWWNITTTLSIFRTEINGATKETRYNNSNNSWSVQVMSNTTLIKGIQMQVSGNYRGKGVNAMGTIRPMYGANIAVKKDFLKNKLNVGININDVFNTRRFIVDSEGQNFKQYMMRRRDTRFATFTLTWKIGSMENQMRKREQRESQQQMREDDI